MKMFDFLEERGSFCVLSLHVQTGRKTFEVLGQDAWNKCLKVGVKCEPEKGRANKELEKELEKIFGSEARIVSGQKSRHKKVLVEKPLQEVQKKLENLL